MRVEGLEGVNVTKEKSEMSPTEEAQPARREADPDSLALLRQEPQHRHHLPAILLRNIRCLGGSL